MCTGKEIMGYVYGSGTTELLMYSSKEKNK